MADQVEGVSTNGKSTSHAAQAAADRAAFLAGEPESDDESDDKSALKSEEDDADDDDREESTDDSDDDDIEIDDDADDDEVEEDDKDELEPKDAETAKRMDAVRRREQRSRDQLATERKAFESERDAVVAEFKPKFEALERFEKLKQRVTPFAVVDLLGELGMSEDDFEQAAQVIYAHSKKGAADPKNREAIARARKDREVVDELKALKAKVEEREKSEMTAKEAAAVRALIEQHVDRVAKLADDETPLAKQRLEKTPAKARREIEKVADALARKSGEVPKAKVVLKAYEKLRRRVLADNGIDPTVIGAPSKGATGTAKPGDKKTAKSKPSDEDKPFTRDDFVNGKLD